MDPSDFRPAGDPRDPRGDPDAVRHEPGHHRAERRRGRRRLIPVPALLLLGPLLFGFVAGAWPFLSTDPGAVSGALAFGGVVVVVAVGGLLIADRLFPQRHEDDVAGPRRPQVDPPADGPDERPDGDRDDRPG